MLPSILVGIPGERVMPSHIKLYGGRGDRFEEIKDALTDRLGYEPTNAEVIGILMAEYPSNDSDTQNDGWPEETSVLQD
jgi:hypothetical protein